MTWGISDFVGDDGNSDGKFKLSLNFPNPEYASKDTDAFLQKLTEGLRQDSRLEALQNKLLRGKLCYCP
jgi:hypothetical protein